MAKKYERGDTYWTAANPIPVLTAAALAASAARNLWTEFLSAAHPDYRRFNDAALQTNSYAERKRLWALRDKVLAAMTPPLDWENIPAPSGAEEGPLRGFMSAEQCSPRMIERWKKNRKGHPGENQD